MKKNYLVFCFAFIAISTLSFFVLTNASPSHILTKQKKMNLFTSLQKNLNEHNFFNEIPEEFEKVDSTLQDTKNEEYELIDESKLVKTEISEDLEIYKEADHTVNLKSETSSAKESTSIYQNNVTSRAVKVEAPTSAVTVATPISHTQITVPATPADSLLKEGVQSENVRVLQSKLLELGYITAQPTGYFGSMTTTAVKWLQRENGLVADGVAGNETLICIDRLLSKPKTSPARSNSGENVLIPWFGGVENIFSRNKTATLYDIATGLSFKIKRTYGYNHADCEPLTSEDTKIMKNIIGGQWSWNRRAAIIIVDGKRIAASFAGMPHAGLENYKEGISVASRSGDFGYGTNLDAVKGNDMSGHFDVHFSGSRTHGTNVIDNAHQSMIQKAATWAKTN